MAKSINSKQLTDALVHSEAQRVDEADASTTYVGFSRRTNAAEDDPVWAIKRIKVNGSITKITFAKEGAYNVKWSERTTLNY